MPRYWRACSGCKSCSRNGPAGRRSRAPSHAARRARGRRAAELRVRRRGGRERRRASVTRPDQQHPVLHDRRKFNQVHDPGLRNPRRRGRPQDGAVQPRQPLPAPFDRLPFTTRRALAAGLGRGRLSGSDLAQPLRGVNLARASPLTLQRRCAALQQRLPAHVYFSGITAASLTGVPLPSRHQLSRAVHVGVPAPHTAPTGRGVIGHQYQNPAWQLWHGLRVSTPARTWCELAASLTVGELVSTGDFLITGNCPSSASESCAHLSRSRACAGASASSGRRSSCCTTGRNPRKSRLCG